MSFVSAFSFVGALIILAATPGPGVIATVARAISSGLHPALILVCGIISGDLLFLLFAVFGLSLIAEQFGQLFILIKYCAAFYCLWRGLKLIFSRPSSTPMRDSPRAPLAGDYLGGLFLTLANPKVILFYCGFLPTFFNLPALTGSDIGIISLLVALVLFLVLATYAWLAARAQRQMSTYRLRIWMQRATGAVLATTGIALLRRT